MNTRSLILRGSRIAAAMAALTMLSACATTHPNERNPGPHQNNGVDGKDGKDRVHNAVASPGPHQGS